MKFVKNSLVRVLTYPVDLPWLASMPRELFLLVMPTPMFWIEPALLF
jgi:hypothetical protein